MRSSAPATGPVFKPRNWTKAEVYVLPGNPPLLIKDYGRCILPARLVGRLFLTLEERALRRLDGILGVPRLVRRIGRNALCMEFVDAQPLSRLDGTDGVPDDFADRLTLLFDQVEGRGVVHGDPHFSNILCDANGQPFLVDFAVSYVRGTVPVLDGWIFRNLQAVRAHRLAKLRRVFYGEDAPDPKGVSWVYRGLRFLRTLYKRIKRKRKGKRRHGTDQKVPNPSD